MHVHEHAQVVLPLCFRWSPTSGPFCLTSAAVDAAMAQLVPAGAIWLVYLKYQIPLHDIIAELAGTHQHMDHTWRWKAGDNWLVQVADVTWQCRQGWVCALALIKVTGQECLTSQHTSLGSLRILQHTSLGCLRIIQYIGLRRLITIQHTSLDRKSVV